MRIGVERSPLLPYLLRVMAAGPEGEGGRIVSTVNPTAGDSMEVTVTRHNDDDIVMCVSSRQHVTNGGAADRARDKA